MGAPRTLNVAVLGAGSIGVSWSIVFARAGHQVVLYDSDPLRLDAAQEEQRNKLRLLQAGELLAETPADISARVRTEGDLSSALEHAEHVQECVPENLDLKRALFRDVMCLVEQECTVASSSSALSPSRLFAGIPGRERALVLHPINPPHLLPVIEVVPASFTRPEVVSAVQSMLTAAGMSPVLLHKEVEGFILNRLQGAVLREAYALVRDGVADVDAIDRVMREGLGRRWAIVGPFETADLNTRGGIAAHAARMGPAYHRMGAERGQQDDWTAELVVAVTAQRRRLLPLECWEERVAWRDQQLIAQERARRSAGSSSGGID